MTGSAYVLRGALIAIAGTSLLVACSSPVAVQAPRTTAQCQQVLAGAPIRVLGELQRETDPRDAAAIAWGSPPIVLVCGVDHRTAPDAQVIEVDGVDWSTESTDSGTVFTTVDTMPRLQLRVPSHYRPEIEAVVEITPTVRVP